ncbi:MAG: hypothetical protein RQM90_04925 [Methanoculleus sp.]
MPEGCDGALDDNPRAKGSHDRRPGRGRRPSRPDRIDYKIRGSPGPVYQALLDRVALGPWSFRPTGCTVSANSTGLPTAPIRRLCYTPSDR